jgi:hypothetical protein
MKQPGSPNSPATHSDYSRCHFEGVHTLSSCQATKLHSSFFSPSFLLLLHPFPFLLFALSFWRSYFMFSLHYFLLSFSFFPSPFCFIFLNFLHSFFTCFLSPSIFIFFFYPASTSWFLLFSFSLPLRSIYFSAFVYLLRLCLLLFFLYISFFVSFILSFFMCSFLYVCVSFLQAFFLSFRLSFFLSFILSSLALFFLSLTTSDF